jgi:hypothetical protein
LQSGARSKTLGGPVIHSMNSQQLTALKELGPQGVIRRYLPRLGKPLEEGGITKDMYDKLLHLVTPSLPQNPGGASIEGTRHDALPDPTDEARGETPTPTQAYSPSVTPRTTSPGAHSDPETHRPKEKTFA